MKVDMANGEKGTERYKALQRVINRHPEKYEFEWNDRGIDLVIGNLGVELKEPRDMIESVLKGHLGEQQRKANALGIPCDIVVFGSPDKVQKSISRMTHRGRKTPDEMIQTWYRYTKEEAKLRAANFTPMYLSENHDTTMEIVMARAWAVELGDIYLPTVKAVSTKVAMMRCLPRIGPTVAIEMDRVGIRPALVAQINGEDVIIQDPNILCAAAHVGPKTAKGVIESLGGI